MKFTGRNNGVAFGKLDARVNNQVQYTLAAFEQKPFKNFFYSGFFNVLRRTKEKFLYFGIPGFVAYQVYLWGERANVEAKRKNPKDYENDV